MIVAGVVIETQPGRAAAVADRLGAVPGLALHGDDGDHRLAAVWCAATGKALEGLAEALVAGDEEILGVFPTFAGEV